MDRLISLEPSNVVTVRMEAGHKSSGSITLRNVMYTMPVAFRLHPTNKARYTVAPQSGIILPLTTLTLEITYHPPPALPHRYPHCDDTFVLQSVVAPGAAVKNLSSTYDAVPSDWFTNKKKQVYSDSGIRIMFVGSAVLTHLVAKGFMDDIREVLEKSDPLWRPADSLDSDGQPLLHLAIAQSRADLVQLLLEFNPDVEAPGREGSTPLEAAAAAGEALIVELLLAHKANPERSEASNWGPIHLAAANGHADVVRHLLLKGADANALTKDGRAALHLAAEERRRDCVRLLLASAARPDVRSARDGETPLHVAAGLGDEQMVKLLLHKGANKDVRSRAGKTAYDLAAESGHARLYDALRLGDSLCAAARKGDLRMVVRLIESGAAVNGRDQNGWTALHRAAFKGRVDVARAVIEKGIDANAKDEEGYTALHCAVESGHVDVIEMLVKKGADVEARTNKGVTALQIAQSLNYSGIIRLLARGPPPPPPHVDVVDAFAKVRDMDKKKAGTYGGRVRRSSFDRAAAVAVV
ncbi:protein VAPYRIN-like [Salvia miltiorrhiza]|uniref:protein VAPYRIN-like n=1 Tax=Salvia miltiorrhiza TaxID=226208 RepID=UPI0025AC00A7|nr:protein VAPYRIN-like [Salvia miltiorrhiza]